MAKKLIKLLAVLGFLVSFALLMIAWPQGGAVRAQLGLAWGVIIIWIIGGGLFTLWFRNFFRRRSLAKGDRHWARRFVIFATIMALIEEAVTTLMTNLAPAFGVKIGEVYLTASTNYLDVVLFHSVIKFVPMFIILAWLLRRIDFNANELFLIFGATGLLAEMGFGGVQNILNPGFWFFIYGLMVYLPAYCLPPACAGMAPAGLSSRARAARPRWWHYPLAIFLPLVGGILISFPVKMIHPVDIHFPR